MPLNRAFSFPEPDIHRKYLKLIEEEVARHQSPDGVIVYNLIRNWIREIARGTLANRNTIPPSLLIAKRIIETRFATGISLQLLANEAQLAAPYLCTEFKRHFGTTPIAYLIHVRLDHAGYLLRDRNLSIGQIARLVGYGDQYQFSKAFRKHHGASPRAVRAALTNGGPGLPTQPVAPCDMP